MKNIFLARIVILFTFALSISGCFTQERQLPPTVLPNYNEAVLLTVAPCSAPCWQGLEIGTSTESEVLATVSSLNFVDQKTIRVVPKSIPGLNAENWVQGKEIIAVCINRWEPCLRLRIVNDKLRDIKVELDYGLTLQGVIEHFGNPDYVGYQHVSSDTIECSVELIWVKEQLILYSTIFTEPKEANDSCYAVGTNGTPDTNLIIVEANYSPLEEIKMRIQNDYLIEYMGTR